ncbi:MAG: hypothetical protein HY902_06450 [Deltaproteobacteria bacterium]|nr:hypothetical protein [Deltaproteobacteria bacterium]
MNNLLKWTAALVLAGTVTPSLAQAGKPAAKAAKPADAKAEPGKPAAAKPEPAKTEPGKADPAKAATPDRELAKLAAQTAKALSTQPAAGQPDLALAVLVSLARSAVVSALHGHFALVGLGQSLRSGGMAAAEVGTMATSMAQNYQGLAEAYGALAGQKSFDPELASLFRSVQVLSQRANQTALALAAYAVAPNEANRIKAFEDALEDYRGRVQALFAQLEQGAQQSP